MTLQQFLIAVPSFLIVLGIVVFVHEFGHFQAARLRKVAIDTFSIGFGKSLLSWRDKQGVTWKVGSIPLGGYVKFADDADGVSMGPREVIEDPAAKAEARRKGMFHAQSLLTRSIVVAAGPVTNFIFAIFAFAVLALIGRDITDYAKITPRVAVIQATPAAAAGLHTGDIVTAIDGRAIHTWRELHDGAVQSGGKPLSLTLLSPEHVARTVILHPQMRPVPDEHGVTQQRWTLGVKPYPLQNEIVVLRYGPVQSLAFGATQTWDIIAQTGTYMAGLVAGRNSGREIAGPIGIFTKSGEVAHEAVSAGGDDVGLAAANLALSLLQLMALISVAVGFVNLLPIPVLDGGHLFFYLMEALRGGKPLSPVAQEWAFRAGLAVMASLFLFATWNDISRLLPGSQG
ncbi:MAG: RIP metalloprotease [Alphaproteobacteria bacterium]